MCVLYNFIMSYVSKLNICSFFFSALRQKNDDWTFEKHKYSPKLYQANFLSTFSHLKKKCLFWLQNFKEMSLEM